jgi:FMN phosphatase YigB (HAD superfamily)
VLSEDVGVQKPDPGIFLHAASRLGVAPRACLHAGDLLEGDVVGAKRAGIYACWFNPKRVFAAEDGVSADAEIRELSELPMVLRQIQNRAGKAKARGAE